MNRKRRHARARVRTRLTVVMMGLVLLAVVGLTLLGLTGLLPSVRGDAAPNTAAASTTPSADGGSSSPAPLARSVPVRLAIASIGVDSTLQRLGMSKKAQQTMQLPPNPKQAGWYKLGPTPGQAGPVIVVGYIASPKGPGVFRHLARLHDGDAIRMTRGDGRVVTYRVDKIASYTKKEFPTHKVYTTSPEPTLRLITCGGTLHPKQKPGNVVVFAHQVSVNRPAPLE